MKHLLFLVLLSSCAYYKETNPGDPASIHEVSWQKVSTEVLIPRCAICHSEGGAGINVLDYQDVFSQRSRVLGSVKPPRNRMPPGDPLTSYELTLIQAWVNLNAPYNTTPVP